MSIRGLDNHTGLGARVFTETPESMRDVTALFSGRELDNAFNRLNNQFAIDNLGSVTRSGEVGNLGLNIDLLNGLHGSGDSSLERSLGSSERSAVNRANRAAGRVSQNLARELENFNRSYTRAMTAATRQLTEASANATRDLNRAINNITGATNANIFNINGYQVHVNVNAGLANEVHETAARVVAANGAVTTPGAISITADSIDSARNLLRQRGGALITDMNTEKSAFLRNMQEKVGQYLGDYRSAIDEFKKDVGDKAKTILEKGGAAEVAAKVETPAVQAVENLEKGGGKFFGMNGRTALVGLGVAVGGYLGARALGIVGSSDREAGYQVGA